jgi:hypothetical protein
VGKGVWERMKQEKGQDTSPHRGKTRATDISQWSLKDFISNILRRSE